MLLGCLVLVLAPSCAAKKPAQVELQDPPAGLARARHVVIVLIDGLRADAVTAQNAPFLHAELAHCAYTLEAQTTKPSVTLPSHASMISGVPPSEHRVTWNTYEPRRGTIGVRTIFDVAHEAGLSVALFGGKEKLQQLAKPGTLDRLSTNERFAAEVMDEALPYLAEKRPNLTLLSLPDVDRAGHAQGWMSDFQREAIRNTDDLLRRLFETLEQYPAEESWAVILTADHGGHGHHHSGGARIDTTIPWILCGGGVQPAKLAPLSITATARVTLQILGLQADRLGED